MGNFDRNGKRSGSGFGRGFGGGKRFSGGRDGRPAMHQATCSECGASCELPFRPTGDRPVFCSNCFGKQDNSGGRPNRFSNERRERPSLEDKKMYDATCSKCGKACQIPFRPTGDRPVFCSNCFIKGGSTGGRNVGDGEIIEQIKMLSIKLDKILERLVPAISIEKSEKEESEKEEKTKDVIKEKRKGTKTKAVAKKSSVKNKK